MDDREDPRPDEEMQRQWRAAMESDWLGTEYDIWRSGFNRGKQIPEPTSVDWAAVGRILEATQRLRGVHSTGTSNWGAAIWRAALGIRKRAP